MPPLHHHPPPASLSQIPSPPLPTSQEAAFAPPLPLADSPTSHANADPEEASSTTAVPPPLQPPSPNSYLMKQLLLSQSCPCMAPRETHSTLICATKKQVMVNYVGLFINISFVLVKLPSFCLNCLWFAVKLSCVSFLLNKDCSKPIN